MIARPGVRIPARYLEASRVSRRLLEAETAQRPDTILGCNGVDVGAGVTNVNLPEAENKRAMVAASDRVIIAADSTKLGRGTLGHVAELNAVDTDAAADAQLVGELRDAGMAILLA